MSSYYHARKPCDLSWCVAPPGRYNVTTTVTCALIAALYFSIQPKVPIVLGNQDGTGQGSHWLIECPAIIGARIPVLYAFVYEFSQLQC